jgi:hypothetical protein
MTSAAPVLRLDQATVVSAAAVFALISAIFAGLSVLPEQYAFIGNVGEVFAPLLCVPVFSRVRHALIAREEASRAPVAVELSGYRFLSFALVATLLLTFLAELFNSLSILQKTFVVKSLLKAGVAMSDETARAVSQFGDGVLVLPLMFLAAVAVGWTLHKRGVARPILCIATIFAFMLAIRILYIVFDTGFLGAIYAAGERLGMGRAGALLVAWASLPLVVFAGCLAGFYLRRAAMALAARAKAVLREDAKRRTPWLTRNMILR